jgi:hypothetical protein
VRFAILIASTALLIPGLCLAQVLESATATLGPSDRVSYQISFLFHPEPLDGPPTLAAPFSADEFVHEIKVLENGTRGEQTQLLRKLYRDSKGRTRSEHRLSLGPEVADPPLVVEIYDAVSGYHYTLDLEKKVAHRYIPPQPGAEVPEAPRKDAAVVTAGRVAATSSGSEQPARRVVTATLGPTPIPPSEKLATRELDGLTVEGTRYTTAMPGGQITTSEIWISTELKLTVLTAITDPQGGERTIRLQNISRSEPDPSLFQVPSGYTVQHEPGEFRIDFTIVR